MDLCIEFYTEFLNLVNNLTNYNTDMFNNNTEIRLMRFYLTLQNPDLFILFATNKIKVFSAKTVETHNISTSLFDETLTLKQIFNNMDNNVKEQLWIALYNLYIALEKLNTQNMGRICVLKDEIKKIRQAQSVNVKNTMFKNVLPAGVNNTTNNMLDDIISSFQNITNNNGNPFDSIMGITDMITQKYSSKIENGEVELDKILGGMTSMLGGGQQEPPIVMDNNFSTNDVELGDVNAKNGFNIGDLTKLAPLTNMLNKVNNIENEDDIMELKKDMDKFMETELKVDMSQYKENMADLEKKLEDMKLQSKNVEEM